MCWRRVRAPTERARPPLPDHPPRAPRPAPHAPPPALTWAFIALIARLHYCPHFTPSCYPLVCVLPVLAACTALLGCKGALRQFSLRCALSCRWLICAGSGWRAHCCLQNAPFAGSMCGRSASAGPCSSRGEFL